MFVHCGSYVAGFLYRYDAVLLFVLVFGGTKNVMEFDLIRLAREKYFFSFETSVCDFEFI